MYLLRMAGDNADVSYNVAWLGNMVMAELTLGICVICFLSLPKFMEVKGKFWLSTLTRISDTAFSIASIARTRGSSAVGNLRDSEATAQAEVAITPLPAVKLGRTLSQVELRQIIVDDESSIPKQVVVSVSTEGRMNSCN